MLSVIVHKDISEYTEKVVGKLSARTLACVVGGLTASVGAAAAAHFGLGVEVSDATFPVMAASMPFWLAGFWRPKGMKAEKFIPLYLAHVLGDGKVCYSTAARTGALAPGIACAKCDRRAKRASRRKGAERREPTLETQRH
ncbi:PrgI family protein [Curtanaerobium respiraculi]|uniref:PrgI family protein n=1 Tax=Curtanaerobium respiraculi TaxID=2949669 RepID=UPI0024B38A47|nr:PrgI family protein [Curtanaerobium respiraculi]